MTFPAPLLAALRTPGRPAFEHDGRVVSRAELLASISRMAAGLRAAGLGRGHGVAMITSLTPEAFAGHLAAHALGCRVVAVRPGWSDSQLSGVLRTQSDAVVTDGLLAELDRSPGTPVTAEGHPDDVARIHFTSGSTGQPKGCCWTYETYGLAFDPARWPPVFTRLMEGFERCLVFGSFAMPVMMTFAGRTLLTGGTVVIGEDDHPYGIERHRATATFATAPGLHRMLDRLGPPVDLGCLRVLMVSGSPVSPRRLAEAVDRLGPVVWQGYGQGESGMISLLTPEEVAHRGSSVGRPLPAVQVKVLGGRIHVRSPYLMSGYWNDPDQTAEVLRDGWLDTRDLGHLDGEGYLHLTGRSRDVIMVEGQVRYAGPIERVLAGHPDVDQAYVVGAADERTGEAIHAFVVPASGRRPDHAVLARLVHAELGAGNVPKTITTLTAVPLGAGGKPDKKALPAAPGRSPPDDP